MCVLHCSAIYNVHRPLPYTLYTMYIQFEYYTLLPPSVNALCGRGFATFSLLFCKSLPPRAGLHTTKIICCFVATCATFLCTLFYCPLISSCLAFLSFLYYLFLYHNLLPLLHCRLWYVGQSMNIVILHSTGSCLLSCLAIQSYNVNWLIAFIQPCNVK